MDEHAEGVNWNEIDVDFKDGGRPREVVFNEIREKIKQVRLRFFSILDNLFLTALIICSLV